MGIFQEMKTIVNRSPVPLVARFDGQDTVIPVGESSLPWVAISYAKNQNPIMGSGDPNNPSMSGSRYLLGVKGVDNCALLTKDEWDAHCDAACRMDWKALMEDRLGPHEHVVVKGKGQKLQAKGSYDAGVRVRAPEAVLEDR